MFSEQYYPGSGTIVRGGVFCGTCGAQMYLSKDGTHRRCPNCDDAAAPR
jgi:NADH pyrophosphatase NudC (nudix superfamily)